MQLGHQGGEHQALGLGARDEGAKVVGRVADVGVGEPEVLGRILLGVQRALVHGPQLAGPAGRQGLAGQHLQAFDAAEPLGLGEGDGGGAVRGGVVDQDHAQVARIVLGQERTDRTGDHIGLVARRHHGDHGGPGRRFGRQGAVVAFAGGPEAAMAQHQAEPDDQGQDAEDHDDDQGRHQRMYPCARNQAMASAMASP